MRPRRRNDGVAACTARVPRRGTCKGACPGEAGSTTAGRRFNDAFSDAVARLQRRDWGVAQRRAAGRRCAHRQGLGWLPSTDDDQTRRLHGWFAPERPRCTLSLPAREPPTPTRREAHRRAVGRPPASPATASRSLVGDRHGHGGTSVDDAVHDVGGTVREFNDASTTSMNAIRGQRRRRAAPRGADRRFNDASLNPCVVECSRGISFGRRETRRFTDTSPSPSRP